MATLDAYGYNLTIPRGDTAPLSPVDGDLWQDTTNRVLWQWRSDISRWASPQPCFTSMTPQPPGNTLTIAPTTGQQVVWFTLPKNYDCYVVRTTHELFVNTTNDASNYWSLNNDSAAATTATNTHDVQFILSVETNTIRTKNTGLRVYVASQGTPGNINFYGSTVEYYFLR